MFTSTRAESHSIVIPLEQGLRQSFDQISSHEKYSIVIPLEQGLRHILVVCSKGLSGHSIVIPLEQGLRRNLLCRNVPLKAFYCHSIRTRIKTQSACRQYSTTSYSIVIPLEQGLRLFPQFR